MDKEEIIDAMIANGWEEVDGKVVNHKLDQSFENWTEAVIACILVASE